MAISSSRVVRVAVIGGGPSAMFFCHSLETQIREARQHESSTSNDPEQTVKVTCFETAPVPGGVWKAAVASTGTRGSPYTANPSNSTTNKPVYDELWTNGFSHLMEFHDYTFDEHFNGEPVPLYLPRQDVNEYILQRVTKNCPTFFQDYFEFNTEVVRVRWIRDISLFEVTVRNHQTGVSSVRQFEKCIWAAGMNAISSIPHSLRQKFEQPSPTPPMTLLHSGETDLIRDSVPNNRIVLIGGGLSAEDLALQCLKWGAAHVHVVARAEEPEVCCITRWPWDRVTVHLQTAVKSVNDDGSIQLERVEFVWPYDYKAVSCDDGSEQGDNDDEDSGDEERDHGASTGSLLLTDIDTVIFCTGYEPNLTMLDESLRPPSGYLPTTQMGQHQSMFIHEDPAFDWTSWRMNSDNAFHQFTGDIPPCQGRMIRGYDNHPDMHRGILFSNPNMMYLSEDSFDTPLMALDAKAWLLSSYVSGRIPIPSPDQLRQANRDQLLEQLQLSFVRFFLDEAYCQAIVDLPHDQSVRDAWEIEESKFQQYLFTFLARLMEEGQYPGLWLAQNMKLNATGTKVHSYNSLDYSTRCNLAENMKKSGDMSQTFRDNVEIIKDIYSLHTGKAARPLKKKWMDIVGNCSIRKGDI